MTVSPDNTDLRVALDEATGSLAAALHLRMPGQAEEGAEWALQALDDIPEDIRARKAGCIAFARRIASEIVADSKSAPPWSRRMHLRCQDLASALNIICDQIRAATFTAQQMAPPRAQAHRRQHGSRNPSLAKLRKAGATSFTYPNGAVVRFDEPEPSDNPNNPWLAAIEKATKQ